jgi:geranylgeranyl pyrophosphate synthase
MIDDLKDVLDSKAKAGKTVARDLLLDRPNAASAMGIPGAVERLIRFIDLGDRTLARLVQAKLGLSFLEKLRGSLEEEFVRLTGNLREMPLGART